MKTFDEWKEARTKEEISEALSVAQRRSMGRRAKRMSKRIQRGKKIKQRRMAGREQLDKRAQRAAREVWTKKLSGGKGKANMGTAQKIAIAKKLESKSAAIKKLSRRLFPKVRKAEKERLISFRSKKSS
jgi:hypothetical protein